MGNEYKTSPNQQGRYGNEWVEYAYKVDHKSG